MVSDAVWVGWALVAKDNPHPRARLQTKIKKNTTIGDRPHLRRENFCLTKYDISKSLSI